MKKILSLLFPLFLCAAPEGETVIHGDCGFQKEGNSLTIIQKSEKAIVHWKDFSLKKNESALFKQPNENAALLNRVVGSNPSKIYGKLEANGKLYLINPNGILVGPNGVIDTKGFIASTLECANAEFLSGDVHFAGQSEEHFENQGTIFGEDIFLISKKVINSGKVHGQNAHLLAGEDVYLMDSQIVVHVKGEGAVENSGVIEASLAELKASKSLPSLAINQSGLIQANCFEERNGEIYLSAEKGIIAQSGEMIAKEISVFGEEIYLQEGLLDVSGEVGGTVLVGGDHKDSQSSAENIWIGENARIHANGFSGDAGKVVILANDTTAYHGFIEAKSFGEGNGGFAEISGRKDDQVFSFADLSGKKPGTFYLDAPITITDGGGATGALTISTNLTSANVTLDTGVGADDVTFLNTTDPISWSSANTFTVIAGRRIDMSAAGVMIANSGIGTFTAVDFSANAAAQAGNFIGMTIGGTITSVNGGINLTATGGTTGANAGIDIDGGTVSSTATAPITIDGDSGFMAGPNGGEGVNIRNSAVVSTVDGNLGVQGSVNGTNSIRNGIELVNATISSSGSGTIALTGSGPISGVGALCSGVALAGTVTSAFGDITINGTANGGVSNGTNVGIAISGLVQSTGTGANAARIICNGSGGIANTGVGLQTNSASGIIESRDGNIVINATGTGTGNQGLGIRMRIGSQIRSIGTGANAADIDITAQGATGTSEGYGMTLEVAGTSVTTIDGDITISATAGAGSSVANAGLLLGRLGTGTSISSTGSGNITLSGTGDGTNNGAGIQLTGSSITSSSTGNISLTGISNGSGINANGFLLASSSTISQTGTGTLSMDGTSGMMGAGVNISDAGSSIVYGSGDCTITGTGFDAANPGFSNIGPFTGGSGDCSLSANFITVGAAITGTGNLTLQPISGASTVGMGAGAAGDFNLDAAELGFLGDGFAGITIGRTGGTHTIDCTGFTFTDPITIQGGDFTLSGLLAAGADAITLISDTMTLTSMITSTGPLTIQPLMPSTSIGLGGGATGTLNLDAAELALLSTGFSMITFGHPAGTGAVDIQPLTFTDPVTIIDQEINLNGAVTTGTNDLTLSIGPAASGTLNVNAIVTTTGTFLGTGNAFDDIFNVNVLFPMTLDGGGGENTLNGPNTSTWNITAQNAGNINGISFFTNMQNVAGGNMPDTFIFADGVGLDGLLDGGPPAEPNVLDYTLWTSPVALEFLTPTSGVASNLGVGFVNIGSATGNILTLVEATAPFSTQADLSFLALNPSRDEPSRGFERLLQGIIDDFHLYGLLYGVINNFRIEKDKIVEIIPGLEPDIQTQYFMKIDQIEN